MRGHRIEVGTAERVHNMKHKSQKTGEGDKGIGRRLGEGEGEGEGHQEE